MQFIHIAKFGNFDYFHKSFFIILRKENNFSTKDIFFVYIVQKIVLIMNMIEMIFSWLDFDLCSIWWNWQYYLLTPWNYIIIKNSKKKIDGDVLEWDAQLTHSMGNSERKVGMRWKALNFLLFFHFLNGLQRTWEKVGIFFSPECNNINFPCFD